MIKGVSSQLKRGLGKEYIVQTEELSSLRGKIDISASVKEQTMLRKRLVCNYDEFSVNSYMNRIIRTTMDTLIRSNISKDRKKQLAALTGHDAAIKETARLTDERLELSDEVIMRLNDQLNMIRDNIGTEQEVSITYFVPDDKKSGGAYLTHSGVVKKFDEFERKLIMQDETVIPIEQISEIQGEIFKGLYE